MRGRKRVIAEVACDRPDAEVRFDVSSERRVTLRFPDATWTGYSRSDFVKHLTADEARSIGRALIDAAEEVTAAEHVQ